MLAFGYPGIRISESYVDFTLEKASPINSIIYDSHAEAVAAVTAVPKMAGPPHYAFYWGAEGRVVVPTTICYGSAPQTTEFLFQTRKKYAEYVEGQIKELAQGMIFFRALGGAYSWAKTASLGAKYLHHPALGHPIWRDLPRPCHPRPRQRASAKSLCLRLKRARGPKSCRRRSKQVRGPWLCHRRSKRAADPRLYRRRSKQAQDSGPYRRRRRQARPPKRGLKLPGFARCKKIRAPNWYG